jgi:phosphoribosylamine--glycine ligase
MANVLVVGSGAREHALVWKLAQSAHRPRVYAAPGNPGMALSQLDGTGLAECIPIAADDDAALVQFARERQIDLVIVGPETPLARGLADDLRAAGIMAFGPGRAGARLEASKSFAKEVMARATIPTAHHQTFTDLAAARAYVERHGAPVVVKADGLAAGKGVTVARTLAEARRALGDALERRVFGDAGGAVVIEDYLEGAELSVMALLSGATYRLLPPAQDHKAAFDGDRGPNTGGMGAFAPVCWADDELLKTIQRRIFDPLVAELARQGLDYRGVLYAGLMVTRDGPQVIEFNVRFGDPEAQVVLPLLEGDLLDLCMAVANGTWEMAPLARRLGYAVGVTLASDGYPGSYPSDLPITLDPKGLDMETLLFHAGTRAEEGQLLTAGGRVFTVVGLGDDLAAARRRAYASIARVSFPGMRYRSDIGLRLPPVLQ